MQINETVDGWKRIRKDVAKHSYESGEEVYLFPCKMRLNNFWERPLLITGNEWSNFEATVNAYSYYNCDRERGSSPIFLVRSGN